ncbi:MAG: hypothetical protein HC828_10450 [Blastochloris sp.]|nr:hypothetical protein [Blastochloris sp.]
MLAFAAPEAHRAHQKSEKRERYTHQHHYLPEREQRAPGEQGHVAGKDADTLTTSRGAKPTAVLLDPDGKIGKLYDARTTPHMYVITPTGTLAYAGAIDDKPTADKADVKGAKNFVRNALDQLAAGKPVDPAVTRAYGCSVKYKS